ncbi:HNH endonuclease [Egicoccus halophilus]|uniref:HNH endonuclease n=1 Tax=Egicoccus halophilus TaxID=1670830 RepID=UPI00197AF92F|nr:HNH endonuclease signature motif containing protein [Egicoccus halophilus]
MASYTTFSFEAAVVGDGDDGYPDELARLAAALSQDDAEVVREASDAVRIRRWPLPPLPLHRPPVASRGRSGDASPVTIAAMFARDGYRCRYCGTRTVAREALEAMAAAAMRFGPDVFPRAPGWRMDGTHPAFYWQYATDDHLLAASVGGPADDLDNLVSACWPCNVRKGNATLEQLGWGPPLPPRHDLDGWDGLVSRVDGLSRRAAERRAVAADVLSSIADRRRSVRTAVSGDVWRRNTRGAYATRRIDGSPPSWEARNGRWRVVRVAEDPRTYDLERRTDDRWVYFGVFRSSDRALRIAAEVDIADGIRPEVLPGDFRPR